MKILAALTLGLAIPAIAAPPPPPSDEALTAVQTLIRATKEKDVKVYAGTLSERFIGNDDELGGSATKTEWLDKVSKEFGNARWNVNIIKVFYGTHQVKGKFATRAMLVENANNFSFGGSGSPDCCAFYLTETLTLDGGKIVQIDRSALFETVLSPTGTRTDL